MPFAYICFVTFKTVEMGDFDIDFFFFLLFWIPKKPSCIKNWFSITIKKKNTF